MYLHSTLGSDYCNSLNPNDTTVGHLDTNTYDYTVEVGHVNPRKPIVTVCRTVRQIFLSFYWMIMEVTESIRVPVLSIHFSV
jgi:hypothetical protein